MALPESVESVRPAAAVPVAGEPGLGAVAIAVAIASVLAAVIAGWLLHGVLVRPEAPPAPPSTADLGAVGLTVDGAWAASGPVPGVRGLPEDTTRVFVPAPGLRAQVIATFAPTKHPSLLPDGLRASLPIHLAEPKPARLAGLPAWHYDEQPIYGGRMMEVTVAPTSAGVLAVACVARTHEWMAVDNCTRGVWAVDAGSARALPPSGAIALQTQAPAAIDRLDARRQRIRGRLRKATTRQGQSRLSGRLARAYETTATRLAPVAAGAGRPGAAVVGRLRSTAAAYRRMAVAARRNRPRAFRRAGARATRREAALNRALARLG